MKKRHPLGPHQVVHLATLRPTAEEYARTAIEWLCDMGLLSDGETLNARFRREEWVRDWTDVTDVTETKGGG